MARTACVCANGIEYEAWHQRLEKEGRGRRVEAGIERLADLSG
jgi:hypothetical protein